MKKRKAVKLVVSLAVLLILIIVYMILKTQNENTEEESVKVETEEIFTVQASDIKKLSFLIENQEVAFRQDEDGWHYDGDDAFPVNADQMSVLTDALLSITANRTLNNVDNLSEYGLEEPIDIIEITDQEEKKTVITIGDTNSSTGDCYIYLNEDKETVYTVDGDLSTVFSGSLMNYAQGEEFPTITADNIEKIEINSQGNSFVLEADDSLVSGWRVTDETGETIEADVSKATEVKGTVSSLNYVNYYEYDCQDFSQYGLEEPYAVIRVDYTETVITDDEEEEIVDESVILSVGDEDGNGNRYTHIEGSTEVHSISIESLSSLLDKSLSDMKNLSVSNIELTSIDKLEVTYQDETHEFTMKEKDSVITYYKDGEETDTLTFSSFYNKAIGITAQEITKEEPEDEEEFSLAFHKTDGSNVEVSYYLYDTNFYIAKCGDNGYLVNKMEVRDLIDKYKELL